MPTEQQAREPAAGSSIGQMLVVEVAETKRRALVHAFEREFAIHQARDDQEAMALARSIHPDIVVTEQQLADIPGAEILGCIQKELPDTIRVLVTRDTALDGASDGDDAVDARHIERPFHTVDLKTVVDALYENRRLRTLAVRDSLTGLFNRRYFVEHLQLELARNRRYQRQLCLLFIDVDDFKQINDRHGHAVGDQVLYRISRLINPVQGGLRSSDFAVRYGGEEFCVVLPDTPLAGGCIKAERIRAAVATLAWSEPEIPLEQPVTISVGVAAFPDHGTTADELVAAADAAQYAAKHAGKNRVVAAAPLPG